MKRKRLFLYWVLLEWFAALAITSMYITGGSLSQFYTSGNNIEYDIKKYILVSVGIFFVLSMLSFLLKEEIKKIGCCAKYFLKKGAALFEEYVDLILEYRKKARINDKYAAVVRKILLALILWLGYLAHMAGARRFYGDTVIFMLASLFMLVAWMPSNRKDGYQVNEVKAAWISLCILQFISDIIIQKQTGFVEIWMLVGFGALYRAWERMEEPEKLWDDFARAAEILYIFTIFYCLFIEPWWENTGISYCGMWKNPNPFSVMIVLFILIMLYRIFQIFSQKKQYWKIICYVGGIAFGIKLILISQCRTALLSCFILFTWALLFTFGKKLENVKISASKVIVVLAAVFLTICSLLVFKGGMVFPKKSYSVTLDEMTSGRLSIWKEYFMQMNLWGHEGDAIVYELPAYAHNVLLKMAFTYGIFAGMVMLILLIEVIRKAFLYWESKRDSEVAFLVMGIVLVYLVSTMIESVDDLPIVWQIWNAFYFVIGFLMIQDGKAGNPK